jgi:hypothetical protein
MKTLFYIIIITSIFGCKNEKIIPKEVQTSNLEKIANVKEIKSKPELEGESFEDLGFKLMQTETLNELKLGLTKNQVTNLLGIPSEISENELWEADGEYHQTYYYKELGIELDMMGDVDKLKKINMITITAPCNYRTSRNISIGSTFIEVENAYKSYFNNDFSDKKTFVAGSIYGGVIFNFENEQVQSIFIGAAGE